MGMFVITSCNGNALVVELYSNNTEVSSLGNFPKFNKKTNQKHIRIPIPAGREPVYRKVCRPSPNLLSFLCSHTNV